MNERKQYSHMDLNLGLDTKRDRLTVSCKVTLTLQMALNS